MRAISSRRSTCEVPTKLISWLRVTSISAGTRHEYIFHIPCFTPKFLLIGIRMFTQGPYIALIADFQVYLFTLLEVEVWPCPGPIFLNSGSPILASNIFLAAQPAVASVPLDIARITATVHGLSYSRCSHHHRPYIQQYGERLRRPLSETARRTNPTPFRANPTTCQLSSTSQPSFGPGTSETKCFMSKLLFLRSILPVHDCISSRLKTTRFTSLRSCCRAARPYSKICATRVAPCPAA